ncbi:hypothetical protein MMC16_004002 [Acarospora aff. strigata]|nr:hypothetical protein [Acarospora aff. strigata]
MATTPPKEEEEEEMRNIRLEFPGEEVGTEIADIMKVKKEHLDIWTTHPEGGPDLVHENVKILILRACATLGFKQTYADLHDLPRVTALEEAAPFEQVRDIRGKYLKVIDPDDPETWLLNEDAVRLSMQKAQGDKQHYEERGDGVDNLEMSLAEWEESRR